MQLHSKELGDLGEAAARRFLEQRGCQFLCANYKTRHGEIDLIMREDEAVLFVEVKTRRAHNSVSYPAQMHPQKIERIQAAAMQWLKGKDEEDWRFVLIEVLVLSSGLARIRRQPLAGE